MIPFEAIDGRIVLLAALALGIAATFLVWPARRRPTRITDEVSVFHCESDPRDGHLVLDGDIWVRGGQEFYWSADRERWVSIQQQPTIR